MADALGMDVGERAEELVDVKLHFEDGHYRLHLVEVARGAVHGLRDVLKHEVEVDFVFLRLAMLVRWRQAAGEGRETRTRSPLL